MCCCAPPSLSFAPHRLAQPCEQTKAAAAAAAAAAERAVDEIGLTAAAAAVPVY